MRNLNYFVLSYLRHSFDEMTFHTGLAPCAIMYRSYRAYFISPHIFSTLIKYVAFVQRKASVVSRVVGIVISNVVAGPALGNLRQEISAFETLRSAHCLSEASLHALVLKVEILANFLQPVYFSLLRFFSYKRKEMKITPSSKRELKRTQ